MQVLKSLNQKQVSFLIGLITASILVLRMILSVEEHGSVLSAFVHLSQFFTILTNTAVMFLMFAISLRIEFSRLLKLAVVVAISGVGIFYHLLLAHLWSPEGLVWLADQGVHTVVPLVSIIWWFVFETKQKLLYRETVYMMIWPLIYTTYALTRASFTGVYPYPFLNVDALGTLQVALNILGLSVGFLVLGLIFILINNLKVTLQK